MSTTCTYSTIYNTQLNQQSSNSIPSIVIICFILPLQLFVMIMIFTKGYKKYKQFIMKKQRKLKKDQKKGELRHDKEIDKLQNPEKKLDNKQYLKNNDQQQKQKQRQKQKQKGIFQRIFFQKSNNYVILGGTIIFLLFVAVCFIFLIMTIFSIYQAVDRNYKGAQCNLNNKITQFQSGSANWVGLEKLMPNITELNLVLNTRTQVSINALKGLILNSTGKANPIGFPQDVCPSVKTCMMAAIPWLTKNTTFSGGKNFTICQGNMTYPIQHPSISGQTIQLNYMNEMCSKMTKQVDDLIQNGNQIDKLLVQLQNIKSVKSTIQTNLSSLNSTYSPIATRSKQYSLQFSSLGYKFDIFYMLPVINFAIYGIVGVLMVFYLVFIVWITCCKCCQCKCDQEDNISQESENYSVKSKKQKQKEKTQQFKEISFRFSHFFLIFLFIINILIGISAYLYQSSSSQTKKMCQNFMNSQVNLNYFNSLQLSPSQKQLLTPIFQCTSAQNQFFMQNIPLTTSQSSLLQLYNASRTFNMSVPKDIYTATSLIGIQTLKQYLFHLQNMPIKSTTFNLIQILQEVNKHSNGSSLDSKQIKECGKSVIQDQYVYNSMDCHHKLMDLVTELNVTEPRCVIIPTYDGTPGTITTHLNKAQHTFVLDALNTGNNCTSIDKMFSPGNSSCFIARRLALLTAQGCNSTAANLGTMLKNLVKFSQQATQYTDVYIQNMRNLFGVYAVLSTNLTQFFLGSNMTKTMGAFGSLSNNLLNRTKCDPIKQNVYSIYASYCPVANTMSMLFNDSFVWTIIVVGLIFVQAIIFYLLDIMYRVYRVEKFFEKFNEFKINNRQVVPVNDSSKNVIQVSQETLIRDNVFYPNDQFHQNIPGQNLGNRLYFQNDNYQMNMNKNMNNKNLMMRNFHHNMNQKSEDTNADMIIQKNSSPVKSKNPYGNFTPDYTGIQYPQLHMGSQKKILFQYPPQIKKNMSKNNIIIQNQVQQPLKSGSLDLHNKSTNNRLLNPIRDEEDFIQDEFKQQAKKQSPRVIEFKDNKNEQKVDLKLNLSNNIGRKTKYYNFEQDQNKIKPQLFYNLEENNDNTKFSFNKFTNINKEEDRNLPRLANPRTPRYNLPSLEQSEDKQLLKKHLIHTGRAIVNNKTQRLLEKDNSKSRQKDDKSSFGNKSKNYLTVQMVQNQLFDLGDDNNQMQVIDFGQGKNKIKKKGKKSKKGSVKQKDDDIGQNKTAR